MNENVLVTSLVGTEKERLCLDTWLPYCDKIVSVNLEHEKDKVEHLFPEVIVYTTADSYMGKYPKINSMLAACAEHEKCIIANSDILVNSINPFDIFEHLPIGGLGVAHRTDYVSESNNIVQHKIYTHGYDVFALNGRVTVERYMCPDFVLALPWWDYWLPIKCMLDGEPVFSYPPNSFLHAVHDTAWKDDEWKRIGQLFSEKLYHLTGDDRFNRYTPQILGMACRQMFDKGVRRIDRL